MPPIKEPNSRSSNFRPTILFPIRVFLSVIRAVLAFLILSSTFMFVFCLSLVCVRVSPPRFTHQVLQYGSVDFLTISFTPLSFLQGWILPPNLPVIYPLWRFYHMSLLWGAISTLVPTSIPASPENSAISSFAVIICDSPGIVHVGCSSFRFLFWFLR